MSINRTGKILNTATNFKKNESGGFKSAPVNLTNGRARFSEKTCYPRCSALIFFLLATNLSVKRRIGKFNFIRRKVSSIEQATPKARSIFRVKDAPRTFPVTPGFSQHTPYIFLIQIERLNPALIGECVPPSTTTITKSIVAHNKNQLSPHYQN